MDTFNTLGCTGLRPCMPLARQAPVADVHDHVTIVFASFAVVAHVMVQSLAKRPGFASEALVVICCIRVIVIKAWLTVAVLHGDRACGSRCLIRLAIVARREPRRVGVFPYRAPLAGCRALCTFERALSALFAHPALTGVGNLLV